MLSMTPAELRTRQRTGKSEHLSLPSFQASHQQQLPWGMPGNRRFFRWRLTTLLLPLANLFLYCCPFPQIPVLNILLLIPAIRFSNACPNKGLSGCCLGSSVFTVHSTSLSLASLYRTRAMKLSRFV